MSKVWIVEGNTGEYSDRNSWIVKVCSSKYIAEQLCEKLNNWCKENFVHISNIDRHSYNYDRIKNPDDKMFSADYTGTNYCAFESDYE